MVIFKKFKYIKLLFALCVAFSFFLRNIFYLEKKSIKLNNNHITIVTSYEERVGGRISTKTIYIGKKWLFHPFFYYVKFFPETNFVVFLDGQKTMIISNLPPEIVTNRLDENIIVVDNNLQFEQLSDKYPHF